MRKTISVRGVDEDAVELLDFMRKEERRFAGALLSDAIRLLSESLYGDDDMDGEYDMQADWP